MYPIMEKNPQGLNYLTPTPSHPQSPFPTTPRDSSVASIHCSSRQRHGRDVLTASYTRK